MTSTGILSVANNATATTNKPKISAISIRWVWVLGKGMKMPMLAFFNFSLDGFTDENWN